MTANLQHVGACVQQRRVSTALPPERRPVARIEKLQERGVISIRFVIRRLLVPPMNDAARFADQQFGRVRVRELRQVHSFERRRPPSKARLHKPGARETFLFDIARRAQQTKTCVAANGTDHAGAPASRKPNMGVFSAA